MSDERVEDREERGRENREKRRVDGEKRFEKCFS